jgi:hypothetical protein
MALTAGRQRRAAAVLDELPDSVQRASPVEARTLLGIAVLGVITTSLIWFIAVIRGVF